MNTKPWDAAGEARQALLGIVRDPQYGVAALSQPAVMTNLLKDMLPDAPREAGLLVAAAQADLAGSLRGYAAQGLDPATAVGLTASAFVNNTSYTQEAGNWVVSELAVALGLDPAASRPTQVAAPPAPPPAPTPAQVAWPNAANPPFNQATHGQAPPSPWQQTPWAAPPKPASTRAPGTVPAGICGLIGTLLVLIACFVPLSTIPGQPDFGVFFGHIGFAASFNFWGAIQPIIVVLACLAASIALLVPGDRPRGRAMLGGMLSAFGIQAVTLFGFDGFGIYSSASHGGGGALGILGGLTLLLGGIIAMAARAGQQPAGVASPGAGPGPAGS
jgi:hypothetical protein